MSSATRATELTRGWRAAEVREAIRETPSATTLVLDVPGWPGHRAGPARRPAADRRGRLPGDAQLLDRVGARGRRRRAHGRAARRRRGVAVPGRRGAAGRPARAARPGRRLVRLDRGRRRPAVPGRGRLRPRAADGDAAPPRSAPAATPRRGCCCRPAVRRTSSTPASCPRWWSRRSRTRARRPPAGPAMPGASTARCSPRPGSSRSAPAGLRVRPDRLRRGRRARARRARPRHVPHPD